MRNLKLTGALVIACLVGLVIATAALAVEFLLAEWLAAGAPITVNTAADAAGEIELEDNKVFGVKVVVLCSLILSGTVGADGEGQFNALDNLAGEEILEEGLLPISLICANTLNCASPKVWAEEPPWKTLVELMVDEGTNFFVNLIAGEAWYVECTVLGVKVEDLCKTAETAAEMDDEPGGIVDAKYSDPFQTLAGLKLATCTVGGVESGTITGLLTMLLTSGTALSVSSE